MTNQAAAAASNTNRVTTIGTTTAVALEEPPPGAPAAPGAPSSQCEPSTPVGQEQLKLEPSLSEDSSDSSVQIPPFWHLHILGAGLGLSAAVTIKNLSTGKYIMCILFFMF